MYARIDDGEPCMLFQRGPVPGKSILDLYGRPNVPVNAHIVMRRHCEVAVKHRRKFTTKKGGDTFDLSLDAVLHRDDSTESGWAAAGTLSGSGTAVDVHVNEIVRSWNIEVAAELERHAVMFDNSDVYGHILTSKPVAPQEGGTPAGRFDQLDDKERRVGFSFFAPDPFPPDQSEGRWEVTSNFSHTAWWGITTITETIDVTRKAWITEEQPGEPPDVPPYEPPYELPDEPPIPTA